MSEHVSISISHVNGSCIVLPHDGARHYERISHDSLVTQTV